MLRLTLEANRHAGFLPAIVEVRETRAEDRGSCSRSSRGGRLARALAGAPVPLAWEELQYRCVDFLDLMASESGSGALGSALADRLPGRPLAVAADWWDDSAALADAVAALLGVPGNDPATFADRRDKAQMQECLRRHGLRALRQCVARSTADVPADLWPNGGVCTGDTVGRSL